MSWIFEKFNKSEHHRDRFDCGIPELDEYLKNKISPDLRRNFGRAVVAISDENRSCVLGFYTLSMGQILITDLPDDLQKKLPRYPVPIARIGRLAVDRSTQGQGLGEELLIHALKSISDVANTIGVYAVVVDSKNKNAERFYKKYGFLNLISKDGPSSLFLPMKTIESIFLSGKK